MNRVRKKFSLELVKGSLTRLLSASNCGRQISKLARRSSVQRTAIGVSGQCPWLKTITDISTSTIALNSAGQTLVAEQGKKPESRRCKARNGPDDSVNQFDCAQCIGRAHRISFRCTLLKFVGFSCSGGSFWEPSARLAA